MLGHFRKQGKVIGEIDRVLRPGGNFTLSILTGANYLIVLEKLLGEPSTFWTPQELVMAFKLRGIHGDFELHPTSFVQRDFDIIVWKLSGSSSYVLALLMYGAEGYQGGCPAQPDYLL